MTVKIPLTQGQVAIVCDCHVHLVEKYKWYAYWSPSTKSFYAARKSSKIERMFGAPSVITMHRTVNETPRGLETDHENHNTLDNRCTNLRNATHGENQSHKRPYGSTSKYKGVSYNRGKWQAHIMANGITKSLGYFVSPEQAAQAYDDAARILHGKFAVLNFPDN